MLPLVEKNSQSSQEGTHLQLKNEELMKEFQLFLEQEQRTPMGKLAEIKYKNIHSVLRMGNQRKQQRLLMKHEQVKNSRMAATDTVCEKTREGFKFMKVDMEDESMCTPMGSGGLSLSACATASEMELSGRFLQLKKKIKEVEQAIFAENMVHDGLKTTLEIQKQVNACLRSKLNNYHHQNQVLQVKNSWHIYVRNMAGCQRISSKAYVDKVQKSLAFSSRKEGQRIEKWMEKSQVLHRQQEQLRIEYLKQACKLDELHTVHNQKSAQIRKLASRHQFHSSKDTLSLVISDIESLIRKIHQNEENFDNLVLQICGKPRTRLRVAQSMDTVRVSQIELINCFEAKYNFKVESAYKIILYVYGRLRQNQKKIVMEFDEWTSIKQEKESELKLLQDKLGNTVEQITCCENDRLPTLGDIHKIDNDCLSIAEQINARNRFLLDVTHYLSGMTNRFMLLLGNLQQYTDSGKFKDLTAQLRKLGTRYDPSDKKESLQKYIAKEKLIYEFVKDSFPQTSEPILKECCLLMTGDSRFMYSIKLPQLKQCLRCHEEDGSMTEVGDKSLSLFGFVERAFAKGHDSHLKYIWEMLKITVSCNAELRNREIPKVHKFPKAMTASLRQPLNPKKFYSVFVSNDEPEQLGEQISNKFIINEPSEVDDKDTPDETSQKAIISKFLKLTSQPISCFEERILAVGGKQNKKTTRIKKSAMIKSRGLKSACKY